MSEMLPEGDYEAEFPYILFEYYMDVVEAGELTYDEAVQMYLEDMDQYKTQE